MEDYINSSNFFFDERERYKGKLSWCFRGFATTFALCSVQRILLLKSNVQAKTKKKAHNPRTRFSRCGG
jgi:hypothetical protein